MDDQTINLCDRGKTINYGNFVLVRMNYFRFQLVTEIEGGFVICIDFCKIKTREGSNVTYRKNIKWSSKKKVKSGCSIYNTTNKNSYPNLEGCSYRIK